MFRACQRASINTFLTRSSRQLNAFKFSTTVSQRRDPWLLPNTPEHEVKTRSDPNIPQLPPIPRPDESVETMRARLVYQSRKRGTLESDLLLSTFAQQNLGSMQETELKEYDRVSDCYICSFSELSLILFLPNTTLFFYFSYLILLPFTT